MRRSAATSASVNRLIHRSVIGEPHLAGFFSTGCSGLTTRASRSRNRPSSSSHSAARAASANADDFPDPSIFFGNFDMQKRHRVVVNNFEPNAQRRNRPSGPIHTQRLCQPNRLPTRHLVESLCMKPQRFVNRLKGGVDELGSTKLCNGLGERMLFAKSSPPRLLRRVEHSSPTPWPKPQCVQRLQP